MSASRVFVSGDTHFNIDINKFSTKNFPIQKELTKNDYVIICGDFGLMWNNTYTGLTVETNENDNCWTKEELYYKKWWDNKPWTTLFVDG